MTNCCDLILDSDFSFRTFFQGADILLLFTTLLFYFFFQCQKHLIRINEKRTGSWFEAICVFYSDGRGHSTKSLFKSFFIIHLRHWLKISISEMNRLPEVVVAQPKKSIRLKTGRRLLGCQTNAEKAVLSCRPKLWVKSETRYLLALKTILDGGLIKATL